MTTLFSIRDTGNWDFELVTETYVVPGFSIHRLSKETIDKLNDMSKVIVEIEDWPFKKLEELRAEVVKDDIKIKVVGKDESSVYEAKAVFLLGTNKVAVWWKEYYKSPTNTAGYTNGLPDFFVGTIDNSAQRHETMMLWGSFKKSGHPDDALVPSIHKLDEESYQKLLELPGVEEQIEESRAALDDGEEEDDDDESYVDEDEEEDEDMEEEKEDEKKDDEEDDEDMEDKNMEDEDIEDEDMEEEEDDEVMEDDEEDSDEQKNYPWPHKIPSLATIEKQNMVVRWGAKGGYYSVEKVEIMEGRNKVRVTWSYPTKW